MVRDIQTSLRETRSETPATVIYTTKHGTEATMNTEKPPVPAKTK